MKKFLGLAAVLLALNTTAFAQVSTVKENYNLELQYPVVELKDQAVTDKINAFYSKETENFRKECYKAGYSEAATHYEVKYEDDEYLALATTYWSYNHGAAHGMYHTDGRVFDKRTGEALPLKHFLPRIPKAKVLDQAIREGRLPFYSVNMPEPLDRESFFGLNHISNSYYIDAEHNVYLIYGPYDLACYAVGNTMVKLNKAIVAELLAK